MERLKNKPREGSGLDVKEAAEEPLHRVRALLEARGRGERALLEARVKNDRALLVYPEPRREARVHSEARSPQDKIKAMPDGSPAYATHPNAV
ncbi:MAG: hypothetical protein JWN92_1595 [Candidatus Acidoferrum typicum]|nr:hypothetical protein [Candidatus Acidoferrum typicum]